MVQNAILTWGAKAKAQNMTISHEGGLVHEVDDLTVLRRFLILGSTGTFYANAFTVTKEATDAVDRAVKADPQAVLDMVLEVSRGKLALKNDPTLYVLARLTLPDVPLTVRRQAGEAVATVARIGTDLLHWIGYRVAMGTPRTITEKDGTKRQTRGYSNKLFRRAISNWFLSRTPDELALQAVKYDSRDGWTMADALRLAKPKAPNAEYAAVFDWMAHPDKRTSEHWFKGTDKMVHLLDGYRHLRRDDWDVFQHSRHIKENRLPREAVPGELLKHREVWEALYEDMPARATIRNLGKLASLGMFDDQETRESVLYRIDKAAGILHPFEFLIAAKVYASGRGIKGSLTWDPYQKISEALAGAFGKAFDNLWVNHEITPIIGLDISGSMTYSNAGGTILTCTEAEAALAAVLAYQFPKARFGVFSHGFQLIEFSRDYTQMMDQIMRLEWFGGGTFCDLPIQYAYDHAGVDAAITITDSETWFERVPASEVVRRIHADGRPEFRHAVVAMATNNISVADPNDPKQLDFVGMDASVPQALAMFLRGEA